MNSHLPVQDVAGIGSMIEISAFQPNDLEDYTLPPPNGAGNMCNPISNIARAEQADHNRRTGEIIEVDVREGTLCVRVKGIRGGLVEQFEGIGKRDPGSTLPRKTKSNRVNVMEDITADRLSERIEQEAQVQLARCGYRSLKAITCQFRGGALTLCGNVPSYYHKQVAQEAMRKVNSVETIVNEIDVWP